MNRMPSALGRRDKNEPEIIHAIEAGGGKVLPLVIGGGVPDLLVLYNGRLHLLEVKSEHGQLNAKQIKFMTEWPVSVVRTPSQALDSIGVELDERCRLAGL